jgi:hypothetical protein
VSPRTRCGEAGFRDVGARTFHAPLRMPSSVDCVRFERDFFGALNQMLAGLTPDEREIAWQEIADELARDDSPDGFAGPRADSRVGHESERRPWQLVIEAGDVIGQGRPVREVKPKARVVDVAFDGAD